MNKKRVKILGLLSYIILASLIVYFTKIPYLYSIILVLIPPAIVNYLWLKKSRKKVLLFSICATLLFSFAVELMSRLTNSWDVQSVLPRVLGFLPLENILFSFINFSWVLSFYEYFVDKDSTKKISKNFKYLIIIFSIFSLAIFTLYFYDPTIVAMDYITLGVVILLIPAIALFSKNPKLLKKTILPVAFFSIVFFIYETVSLIIGSWWWPGQYVLPINLFGHVFPLDDVIIWYFLSTITLIGGYEFFSDDFN